MNEDGGKIYELYNGTFKLLFSTPNLKNDYSLLIGNFNNDNKSDILIQKVNSSSPDGHDYYFLISTGDSFVKQTLPSLELYDKWFAGDFNLDGRTDLVIAENKDNKFRFKVGIFNGNDFTFQYYSSNLPSYNSFYWRYLDVADYTGDGRFEICYDHYSDVRIMKSFNDDSQLHVKQISNGFSENIAMGYEPLTNDLIYKDTQDAGLTFPVVKTRYPIYVLRQLQQSGSHYQSSYYYYSDVRIHKQGRGLLGFLSVRSKNYQTGIETETVNTLNTTYYILVPHSTETRYGSSKISQQSQDITLISKGSKRYWARTNSVTSKDFLENRSTKQTYSAYDSYGNPKTIKTEYLANGSNSGIYETKSITYTNAGSWCPNKPETVTVTKTNKNGSQTRTHKYSYDQKGNLTKKQRDVGDKNELVTIYDNYDSFGNPRIITTKVNGKSRSTTLEYTASGRFMKKKTDDFTGFSTKYNYNETTGVLTSETDHSGLTTTYEYDGFGRQIKATYPDGRYAVKTYQWAGGYGPNGAVYYTYEEISGESPVWTWYDGLGRELRTAYYGFDDSKKIWVDTDYNSKGQIESISKPYFANGTKEPAETYTYDNYGRVSTKTTPMGTTSITYNGLTTSISSPRSEKEETRNAAGQIVTSKTDGGTVSFTYYPSGKVKTATPQDGAAVEMYYNLQGNRTKIIDPDAGTIETTYNGYGELISEKYTMGSGEDERTVITSYTYDDIGRPDVIDRNGEIIDYSYNSDGFLQSVTKPDHEVIYTYDEGSDKKLGRLTSVKEQIDGKIFTFRTAYDAFGREKKRTYPSGFSVDNVYTKYGHLKEVTDSNGKSIWKGEKVNAPGQFVKTSKGGKTTTFGYDEKDRLESIVSPDIINHFYVFNEKGNLESREDKLTGQLENFTYDKHQLKTWKIKQGGALKKTFSMNYDAQGNITGKSDLGYEMKYDGKQPHALSSIEGNPSLISDEEQSITYTDFKKTATINEEDNSLELAYGVDNQRRKAVFKTNGETTLTRYYLGDYEEEQTTDGKTRKIHYLSGGNGLAAIFVEENSTAQLYYVYTDYLGSLTALTDKDGNIVERQAFDPWGNRRNPNDWTSLITTPVSHITGRGYTMLSTWMILPSST